MSQSEWEKLVARAKTIGIDLNLIMDELDRRIESKQTALARDIVDKIPSIKPDIDEITKAVAERIQAAPAGAPADIETIVAQVVEKIPDTGAVERKRVLDEAAQQIKDFLNNIDSRIEGMVRPLVDEGIMAKTAEIVQAVRDEMNSRMEEIASKFQGNGSGKGGKWGGIPWDQLTPILEKMVVGGQDPLAGLDTIITLREKLAALEPQGPDATAQFRSASASFLEGVKLGARTKGVAEPKKLSGPPGGPSKQPVKPTRLHPAIESL